MADRSVIEALERDYNIRTFTSDDGGIEFSCPAQALRQTLLGDSREYQKISCMMMLAEAEEIVTEAEKRIETLCAERRKGNG